MQRLLKKNDLIQLVKIGPILLPSRKVARPTKHGTARGLDLISQKD